MVLTLCSCGYRFGDGLCLPEGSTISVPFVEGDRDGTLTASIVKELSRSTNLRYYSSGGRYSLRVKIVDLRDENIGFRYDRDKEGERTRSLIPIESRMIATVEVSVCDTCTCEDIVGPVLLIESIDFDHDYYSSRNAVNIFSLGQVSDIDSARDDVYRPLSDKVAIKVVNFIIEAW